LAQTAPVLNQLRARLPELRLTVQCGLDQSVLIRRIDGPFEHIPKAADFGFIMADPSRVRVAESLAAYHQFHATWEQRLRRQTELLSRYQPDLVLANVPYLPLEAAHRLGIRCLAMCSLNWADLLEHYSDGQPGTRTSIADIRNAYNRAELFLQPEPSMPMRGLNNRRRIGPVADSGRQRRQALRGALGIPSRATLVLVTLGGIDGRLAIEDWELQPGIHWLTPLAWNVARADCHPLEETGFSYLDALASCDALLTKPGYGSFVEAACAGVPVLYVARVDWPEEPYLVSWLSDRGRLLKLPDESLARGQVKSELTKLLNTRTKPAITPSGIDEAVDLLVKYVGQ
jgi:hypothetical protein